MYLCLHCTEQDGYLTYHYNILYPLFKLIYSMPALIIIIAGLFRQFTVLIVAFVKLERAIVLVKLFFFFFSAFLSLGMGFETKLE